MSTETASRSSRSRTSTSKAGSVGTLNGHRQVTLYIDDAIYERAKHVANMLDVPVYRLVNEALEKHVDKLTTPEQKKAMAMLIRGARKSR